MKLTLYFFENKNTLEIARDLIGKVLICESGKGFMKGIICETEAYTEDDESSHTFEGLKTKRNQVMFKRSGHLYVYFTYGMHNCCNIVTGEEGKGEAVLIRAIIPLEGIDLMKENRRKDNEKNLSNGPAKLCQAYGFDKEVNGYDLLAENSSIYIEDVGYKPIKIDKTTRIGISRSKELKWRFVCDKFEKN